MKNLNSDAANALLANQVMAESVDIGRRVAETLFLGGSPEDRRRQQEAIRANRERREQARKQSELDAQKRLLNEIRRNMKVHAQNEVVLEERLAEHRYLSGRLKERVRLARDQLMAGKVQDVIAFLGDDRVARDEQTAKVVGETRRKEVAHELRASLMGYPMEENRDPRPLADYGVRDDLGNIPENL